MAEAGRPTEKQCNRCLKVKDISLFGNNDTKDGHRSICKDCDKVNFKSYLVIRRERYLKNKDKILEKIRKDRSNLHDSSRKNRLLKAYNLTTEAYQILLELQNGVCAICGKGQNKGKFLSVDHDHKTGKVRGLLCQKCNTAIGLLDDNIGLIKKAYNYLYEE